MKMKTKAKTKFHSDKERLLRRLEVRLPGADTETGREALAYLQLLLRLPRPGDRVRLPDGRTGIVQEVRLHSCYGLGPPDWGWRVVVRPEGGLPYEDVLISPLKLK